MSNAFLGLEAAITCDFEPWYGLYITICKPFFNVSHNINPLAGLLLLFVPLILLLIELCWPE